MAEEQFTSRRARREAERMAAEQAFEARETPEQPSEPSSNEPAQVLDPPPATAQAPDARTGAPEPGPSSDASESAETTSRSGAESPPHVAEERNAADVDRPLEAQSPVVDEGRLDPQQAPLPHFDSRTARKNYLREHGLSLEGDVSTGAIPVVAGPEETPSEAEEAASGDEDEAFDAAGFGGSADEVAARDFEAPVTADSAPRPTTLEGAPHDAPSQPIEDLDTDEAFADPVSDAAESVESVESVESAREDDAVSAAPELPEAEAEGLERQGTESTHPAQADTAPTEPEPSVADDEDNEDPALERDSTNRSRRMPIVQPPSSSGVRVVTAASAQISETESPAPHTETESDAVSTGEGDASTGWDESTTSAHDSAVAGAYAHSPDSADRLDSADDSDSAGGSVSAAEAETSSDDAARALAANPETRPMETVPEAWALPNPDYEDEETDNPPGTRIRASDVTGHDGRILVGEEPSKVPYVVLGVAALFAVALIVIALVMLL